MTAPDNKESKAREFIVMPMNKLIHDDTGLCIEFPMENNAIKSLGIHVIEHSAYQALEAKLAVAEKALEHYANHESVIKEAYHSNDERQITCVHTFINHVAKEALKSIRSGRGDG